MVGHMLGATENEMVFKAPHMLWSGVVSSQPENALDPTQVEALRNVVIIGELLGCDGYGAWRRSML